MLNGHYVENVFLWKFAENKLDEKFKVICADWRSLASQLEHQSTVPASNLPASGQSANCKRANSLSADVSFPAKIIAL